MNIQIIQYSLWTALVFSLLQLSKDWNDPIVSDSWFIPVIVAVLWSAYKS